MKMKWLTFDHVSCINFMFFRKEGDKVIKLNEAEKIIYFIS